MSNLNLTYNPSDVRLKIGGYEVVGWDNVRIARTKFGFNPVQGIRGKHTRVPSGDTSASITLTLVQTSPSNDVLSEIYRLDEIQGTGRIALTLKDSSGKSVFSSSEAYVTGYPETVFSGDFEYRAWTIFCQTTDSYTVAGNTEPSTFITDALSSVFGNIF